MNPNFKKKKPLPYKNLGELYTETAYQEPSISRLISILLEDSNTQETLWDNFQKKLYNTSGLREFGAKTGAGPGEYSVAALELNKKNPETYTTLALLNTELANTELATIVDTLNNYVQGGDVSYDVEINNQQYEVKQINDKTSAKTGANARGLANKIFNIIKQEISDLYERYNALSVTNKEIIKKITPGLSTLLIHSQNYLKGKNCELAPGALGTATAHVGTPEIFKLPEMFETLLTEPDIKEVVSLTAKEIERVYNVEPFDAKVIDIRARDYISNRNKNNIPVSEETKFSDFLLMASQSSFSSQEEFDNNIGNYFIPRTAKHKEALQIIFPGTGVYVVSPEGYIYVPKEDLDSVIKIFQISGGTLKIILQNQISNA